MAFCLSSKPWLTPFSLLTLIQLLSKTDTLNLFLKKFTLHSTDIWNYRPISLLSFLSKPLEHAVYNQMSCYLSYNNLFDLNQSGLRTAYYTETALLTVTDSLGAVWASSHSSSAFDTVNLQILLSTLAELGNADSALTWFTSYLTNWYEIDIEIDMD